MLNTFKLIYKYKFNDDYIKQQKFFNNYVDAIEYKQHKINFDMNILGLIIPALVFEDDKIDIINEYIKNIKKSNFYSIKIKIL